MVEEYFNEATPFQSMKTHTDFGNIKQHKKLVINDVVYAYYTIENGHMYFNMQKPIIKNASVKQSENMLIHIIQEIEEVKLHTVSFLNIHGK